MKKTSENFTAKSSKANNSKIKSSKEKIKNKPENPRTAHKSKGPDSGLKALSTNELLAQLLKFTPARKAPKETADILMRSFSSFRDILDARAYELAKIGNLGKSGALLINLAREIITRYRYDKVKQLKSVFRRRELYKYCLTHLQNKKQEFFEVLFLNSRMRLISSEVISEGDIDNAAVSPRKILELILKHNAKYIICVHNHPSGDPSPSAEDVFTTSELQEALETIPVYILDHIIVGAGKVYSMDKGSFIKFKK